jgi:hypothetical protein
MMKSNTWSKDWEWNGVTVAESKHGYIITRWSRIQGALDGRKVLLPFSTQYPRGLDLEKTWNDFCGSTGERISDAECAGDTVRVLRSGSRVN